MMASGVLARADRAQFRDLARTSLVGTRAAGAEAAARRRRDRRRRLADRHALRWPDIGIGHRDRLNQQRGIGMRGAREKLLRRPDLADPAEIHHRDAVTDCFDHGKVVGDEQQRQAETGLHLLQQVEDLRADGDVERRDRLVADDEFRVEHQRARNADALALPAGKFVRQPTHHQRGIKADRVQHLADAIQSLLWVLDTRNDKRLGHDVTDTATRIERGDRVLEDELRPPAHLPQGLAPHGGEILAVEQHPARYSRAQLQYRAAEGRFAATGLADEPQRLAARDLEADIRNGMYGPVADAVLDNEVFDAQKR